MICNECGKEYDHNDLINLCWECWWNSAEGEHEWAQTLTYETEDEQC